MTCSWTTGLLMVSLVLGGCSSSSTTGEVAGTIPLDVASPGLDGVAFVCDTDECMIDGACLAHMAQAGDSPCQICDIFRHRTDWSPLTGGTCDDDDACTSGDACLEGSCVGEMKVCDDGDQCTTDSCDDDTGECETADYEGSCDDGDDCTVGDKCSKRLCLSGEPETCDDAEPCTVGACSQGSGCDYQALDVGPCDDGNACTLAETCQSGVCTPNEVASCDDGNICTADGCDLETGCFHTSYDGLCDDGDQCTDDACDVSAGCTHEAHVGPCDDDDACTETDSCQKGLCTGSPVAIDDGNDCTDDACDPTSGVSHVANEGPCDDGDACTAGDICSDEICQLGTEPVDCDDSSVCTTDACDSEVGCVYAPALECDDGNACTKDSCDATEGCVVAVVETNDCRPQITIDQPPRGATLLGDPAAQFVAVSGSASSQAGALTSITINGIPVDFSVDGAFSVTVPAFVGGNTLIVEAEDVLGTSRKRVQAYHWSPEYLKESEADPDAAMADPGAAIYLSPAINEKLEEIFEAVLAGFDIAQFVPNPITPEPVTANAGLGTVSYIIYLAGCPEEEDDCCVGGTCYDFFTYDAPTVEITAIEGGLAIKAVIANITAGIWGKRTGCSILGCLAPAPLVGTMNIDDITIDAELALSVTPEHELEVELTKTEATFTGVSVEIDHWTAFLIEGIINDQIGGLLGDVEDEFAAQMDETLAPMISQALSALAFEAEFPLPALLPGGEAATLKLFTDFADVDAGVDGMLFALRAGTMLVTTPGEETPTTPWDGETHLGAVARSGCAVGDPGPLPVLKSSPLELLMGDDTMNLLLHSAWQGGFLEFDVPPELLADVDLSQYGVEDLKVEVSGMLPPVLSDCNLDELKLHIGDLRIDATMSVFGKDVDVLMYLSLSAGFAFNVSDAGLSFGLTELDTFESEVTVSQGDLIVLEPIIQELVTDSLMGSLLGQLSVGECAPTEGGCDPACAENEACDLASACVCDIGAVAQNGGCVPSLEACGLECAGSGICVVGANGESCACAVGFGGSSCHDCVPGYSIAGGLAAFPLPELDLGGGALPGAPPIEIIPFESVHVDGFTIISGDLQ